MTVTHRGSTDILSLGVLNETGRQPMTIRRTDTSESISIGAFELAAVLATVLVLALVYYLTQEPAQFFHFVDWEGLQYY